MKEELIYTFAAVEFLATMIVSKISENDLPFLDSDTEISNISYIVITNSTINARKAININRISHTSERVVISQLCLSFVL
jgi:hypothetical protein